MLVQKLPFVDISIRWKLLLAFLATGGLPPLLVGLGLPWYAALVLALALAAGMAWYSGARILSATACLSRIADRLLHGRQTPPAPAHRDELSHLLSSFSALVASLETARDPAAPAPAPEPVAKAPLERTELRAAMTTGDPVMGEAFVLPRRVEEDLLLTARLTGSEGQDLFDEARALVHRELLQLRAAPDVEESQKGIIDFQLLLLDDESFLKGVASGLRDHLTLPESVGNTIAAMVAKIEAANNPYIRARAHDCLDLKEHLHDAIFRKTNPGVDDLYADATDKVALCQQIFPSDVIALHRVGARGIVSAQGTRSSHAQILMQSFNLPSLSEIEGLPVHAVAGNQVLLDTRRRRLVIGPTQHDVDLVEHASTSENLRVIRSQITTACGKPVHVMVTINNIPIETPRALASGCDGVGLFRSEMNYIGRADLPGEDELSREYGQLTQAFPNSPVVMRMLDLGSDKLASFQQDDSREENPCMGNRSMRLLLRRRDIFRTQLRAMLRAASPHTTIIFPMISGWRELEKIQQLVQNTAEELQAEGVSCAQVRYGIMVEVPGIVERFDDYVREFDLFNLGTNDLTQYSLAADRNNRDVSEYFSYLHPSVLSMIHKVATLATAHDKPVCVCGEMASDISAVPLLLGLGIRSFSVPYQAVPRVKATVMGQMLAGCETLARKALECRSTTQVEALLRQQARILGDQAAPAITTRLTRVK